LRTARVDAAALLRVILTSCNSPRRSTAKTHPRDRSTPVDLEPGQTDRHGAVAVAAAVGELFGVPRPSWHRSLLRWQGRALGCKLDYELTLSGTCSECQAMSQTPDVVWRFWWLRVHGGLAPLEAANEFICAGQLRGEAGHERSRSEHIALSKAEHNGCGSRAPA
jgi:hypothetical protein